MSYKITLEIGKNEISAWVDDDSENQLRGLDETKQ